MEAAHRVLTDPLGDIEAPADALYGPQTARAVLNFPLSGRQLGSEAALVAAFARVKAAAAEANTALGAISAPVGGAIISAAERMADGDFDAHLVVDLFEGSGGTSLNMNVNEVLAAVCSRNEGDATGQVLPNEHVNRSQSTNDVVPTAIKLACRDMLAGLEAAFDQLASTLRIKQSQFAGHLRLGRTCLQDAQPMTLGQAFGAWATFAERCARSAALAGDALLDLPLGATAIGTGFGAAEGYRPLALAALSRRVGAECRPTSDMFDGLANADCYARLSGELKAMAGGLAKVANDLVILSSGPHGGLAELALPAVQPGSSIMPGKVNPVIPLAVCQVGFAVAGYDAVVGMACQQGQLEINPYEPVIAAHLFDQIRLTTRAATLLNERCIQDLEARADVMLKALMRSSAVSTALVPEIGYAAASALVSKADAEGRDFLTVAAEAGVLSHAEGMRLLRRSAGLPD